MSLRRVRFWLRRRPVIGFLVTDQAHDPERRWFVEADVPAEDVLDLTYSQVIDLRMDYHDGTSHGSGIVEEVQLAPEGARLRITGRGPLDRWPVD
jgi:hypothetical protein